MITVADILSLPAFEHVELAAPCENAGEREVVNVGIVDCPPDYNGYTNYFSKELILTNLGFAYNNEELAERSLLALIERNVSAIAVKRVYRAPVSERVLKASTEKGVPVYLNDGAYYERVAYEALNLIERDRADADHAQAIEGLLNDHDGEQVRRVLYDIAGATGASIQCFALAPKERDAVSLYAACNTIDAALSAVQREYPLVDAVRTCRYHNVILAFVSYAEAGTPEAHEARLRCEDLIALEGTLSCGESDSVQLTEGDLAVRQAMAALEHASLGSERLICWRDMGFAAFAHAARTDRLFTTASTSYRQALIDYDKIHGTEILRTIESLLQHRGDIKETSEALYQHPNTVRYRLRKAKAILGCAEMSDREFIQLMFLAFLPTFRL